MVVAPHMDDEVIGCGGLIQAYRKSGSQVAVVFLTDGAARNLKPAEIDGIRRARRAESEAAAATLGISECLYLDLPERELAAATAEPEPLAGALAEQRPDVILIPADDEYHPDHRAAHRWTRSVVDHLGLASRIVCYEVWGNCRPNRILALDEETWDRNVSAMKTYRTQLREMDYCRIMSFVRETRGRSAFPGTGRKAEVFRVLEPGEAAA